LLKNEEGTTKGLQDSTELYREKEDLAEILVGVLQEDLAQGNLGKKIKKLYAEEYLDDSEGFASDNNPMVGKPTNSVLNPLVVPSSFFSKYNFSVSISEKVSDSKKALLKIFVSCPCTPGDNPPEHAPA
jgi:hypothetical protein